MKQQIPGTSVESLMETPELLAQAREAERQPMNIWANLIRALRERLEGMQPADYWRDAPPPAGELVDA